MMYKQFYWCMLLFATAAYTSQDGDSGFAILHMEGNRTAVTVHMPDGKSSVFYFPGSTRLIQPCTSLINACPDLVLDVIFKEQGSQRKAIIMAKFVDAIGFMELQWLDGGSDVMVVASEILLISSQSGLSCNPLDITNQGGDWVVYCITQSQQVLDCVMTVNFTKYTNTELSCRYLGDADIQEPSDFLYVPNYEYVFFTDRSKLYRVDLSQHQLDVFADLSISSCRHLNYLPHNDLTLYCGSGVATEVGFDRIEHMHALNGTGFTFACEESNQFFVVRQRRMHIEIVFNNQTVALNATHFLDAKCILKKNEAFIFVLDAYTGVSMLTGASTHIFPIACTATSPCRSIQLYSQPTGFAILILKEGIRHIEAIAFDKNLHEVLSIELMNSFAGFTALYFPQIHSPSSTMKNGDKMMMGENNKSFIIEKSIIGSSVAAGIVFVIILVAIPAIITVVVLQKRTVENETSSSTSSANTSSDNLLGSAPPGQGQTPESEVKTNTLTTTEQPSTCLRSSNSSSPQPLEAEKTSTKSPSQLPEDAAADSTFQGNISGPGDSSIESVTRESPPRTNHLQELQYYQAIGPYQSNIQGPVTEPQEAVDGAARRNPSQLESTL